MRALFATPQRPQNAPSATPAPGLPATRTRPMTRLAIALARTAARAGATLVNYARVTGLLKHAGLTAGVDVGPSPAAANVPSSGMRQSFSPTAFPA